MYMLQQYLPFTVLKPRHYFSSLLFCPEVATVLTVYGIETTVFAFRRLRIAIGCNSTYRLRY